MKKILITGSSGMVGRNFVNLLKKKNNKYLTPNSKELNLLNKNSIKKYLSNNKIDTVLHLAAKVGGIQANIKNNLDFYLLNSAINFNLITECYHMKIPKLLNIASTCVYPANIKTKLSENMLFSGKLEITNEGYALAKLNSLKLCEYISKQNKSLSYKTIIPCNMYGLYDKFEEGKSHLVPAIIHKLIQAKLNNEKSVTIWGSGNARREFMFAEDFAKIIIKILDNFDNLPGLMNIGTGKDYRIIEYYKIVKKIINWKGSWIFDLNKPEGMKRKLADISKLKELNLMPKTPLELGIKKTIKYYNDKTI